MNFLNLGTGPEIILHSCSAQLSMKFILLLSFKMSTGFGILILMKRINTTPGSFRARKIS